jgi:hemerythrin-like metal-binding protein
MYIQWENGLELGLDLIDAEHRMLMLLCRKLDVAIKSHQPHETVRLVALEVKRFTAFHFFSEENVMREIGYPELDEHVWQHTELMMRLNAVMTRINNREEQAYDFLALLYYWLRSHLVEHDAKIAAYAVDCQLRPIAADYYRPFLANWLGAAA